MIRETPTGTGKSCLIKRFCEGKFVKSYIETVGIDFGVKPISLDEKALRVNFFDLSGDKRFREVRNEFYRDTQGAILVFDPSKRETFENLSNWIQEANTFGADSSVSYVVLANINSIKVENRKVTEHEARTWAEKQGMEYFEVNAKTGKGVEMSFTKLFRNIMSNIFREDSSKQKTTRKLIATSSSSGGGNNPPAHSRGASYGGKSRRRRVARR